MEGATAEEVATATAEEEVTTAEGATEEEGATAEGEVVMAEGAPAEGAMAEEEVVAEGAEGRDAFHRHRHCDASHRDRDRGGARVERAVGGTVPRPPASVRARHHMHTTCT